MTNVPEMIRQKYAKELGAYEQVLRLVDEVISRNHSKLILDPAHEATKPVSTLLLKAWKTADAIHLLAREGYGEDALDLTRTITNIAIDMGYICRTDSDERARQWIARGRIARREMAKLYGRETPDETKVNWGEAAAFAKKWKDVNIVERAKDAGLENFYKTLYAHGSSIGHSDAWGVESYLEQTDRGLEARTGPGEELVANALFGIFALAEITLMAGKFFTFEFGGLDQEIRSVIEAGFKQPKQRLSDGS